MLLKWDIVSDVSQAYFILPAASPTTTFLSPMEDNVEDDTLAFLHVVFHLPS